MQSRFMIGMLGLMLLSSTGCGLLIRGVLSLKDPSPPPPPALYMAAGEGALDDLQIQLRGGWFSKSPDVNERSYQDYTLLEYAIDGINRRKKGNHFAVIELLIEKGAHVNARDFSGQTPLHRIAQQRRTDRADIAGLLINAGADITVRGKNRLDPLSLAVQGGNKGIVQLLLSKGVDPSVPDRHVYQALPSLSRESWIPSPLFIAAEQHERDIFQLLLERGASPRPLDLYLAISRWNHDPELLTTYLDSKISLNLADPKGKKTALHYAANQRDAYSIGNLLSRGAAVNSQDSEGNTPLLLLLKTQVGENDLFLAALRKLLEGHADITLSDSRGKTPTSVAVERGFLEALKILRQFQGKAEQDARGLSIS